eukprot:9333683-Pyramimonas_sp.AAC.1
MSDVKDIGRSADTFLTDAGPDFRMGAKCRSDHRRAVTHSARPRFSKARVKRKPSSTLARNAALQ